MRVRYICSPILRQSNVIIFLFLQFALPVKIFWCACPLAMTDKHICLRLALILSAFLSSSYAKQKFRLLIPNLGYVNVPPEENQQVS